MQQLKLFLLTSFLITGLYSYACTQNNSQVKAGEAQASTLAPKVCSVSHGFTPDTLVKTAEGYLPIGELEEGDEVVCVDEVGRRVQSTVSATKRFWVNKAVYLSVAEQLIITSSAQPFFCAGDQAWESTAQLSLATRLRTLDATELQFDAIKIKKVSMELVAISIAKYQNFCVTEKEIIVHNLVAEVAAATSASCGAPQCN